MFVGSKYVIMPFNSRDDVRVTMGYLFHVWGGVGVGLFL